MDDRLRDAPLGVLEVTRDGVVAAVDDTATDIVDGLADAAGAPVSDVFPRSVEDSLPSAFAGETVDAGSFEEYYPALDQWLAVTVTTRDADSDDTGPGTDSGESPPVATVFLEDVTERRRYEQTVERFRTERARTAVIDALLSDVLAELVGADSRDEIAETICSRLGETELYEFAWVGERAVDGDGVAVRAAAGATGETFDAVRETLASSRPTAEERAVQTGDLQVVAPLAEDPAAPEPVRRAGFADGVQSLLAIPLAHGSTVHGVVGVYATGSDAFGERERASFRTLGEVAGFAVTAVRNRSLLRSDAVTEVTFDVDRPAALADLSAALDARVALEGTVPQGDDGLLCYVSVDDGDVDRLAAATADGGETDANSSATLDVPGVDAARVVHAGESGGTLELEVRGDSPLLAAENAGGTVQRAEFASGSGRVVVDLPPDGDVRRMVAAVCREFEADVQAKRDRERSPSRGREFRDELGDELTDRQQTVLRTAYLAGYFESPRGSTAEEVASSLDITGSTLLHHLRASQRKLLDAFFDGDARPGNAE
jgi:DNA-binding CsgD family transcriptional regulator